MLLLHFPTTKGKQEKFAAAVFVPSCTHFSLWLILCNTYILQAWVWRITGNKTNATIREVQDKSHLPPCLRTAMPLFLLSVILGLLPALPTAWPGSAFLLLGLIDWMRCWGGKAQVGTAPCWWGTGAISSQASGWTTVGCDVVIHCKKIVALLFRSSWPRSSHPSRSDLGSGGPGLQAMPRLSC